MKFLQLTRPGRWRRWPLTHACRGASLGPNVGTDLGHEVKSQFLLMPWKNGSAEIAAVTRGNSPAAAVPPLRVPVVGGGFYKVLPLPRAMSTPEIPSEFLLFFGQNQKSINMLNILEACCSYTLGGEISQTAVWLLRADGVVGRHTLSVRRVFEPEKTYFKERKNSHFLSGLKFQLFFCFVSELLIRSGWDVSSSHWKNV